MINWIIDYYIFDEGDYVVTIRPDFEESWKVLSIGGCLSEKEAKLVVDWLKHGGLETLWKLFENTYQETKA